MRDIYPTADTFEREVQPVREWVKAAVTDGWAIEPIYGDHESADRAAKLTREGFIVMAFMRPPEEPYKGYVSITAWGPDKLQITVPLPYAWDRVQQAVNICMRCGKETKTGRVGFAGRYCAECSKVERPRKEFPGWTS